MDYKEIQNGIAQKQISDLFSQTNGNFHIESPCIFSEGKVLRIGDNYDLVDFLYNGGLNLRDIKLIWVSRKGFTFSISGIDIRSGEIINRSSRLGFEEVICNWIIADPYYFQDISNNEESKRYCNES